LGSKNAGVLLRAGSQFYSQSASTKQFQTGPLIVEGQEKVPGELCGLTKDSRWWGTNVWQARDVCTDRSFVYGKEDVVCGNDGVIYGYRL